VNTKKKSKSSSKPKRRPKPFARWGLSGAMWLTYDKKHLTFDQFQEVCAELNNSRVVLKGRL
jgi:hypothetical protein